MKVLLLGKLEENSRIRHDLKLKGHEIVELNSGKRDVFIDEMDSFDDDEYYIFMSNRFDVLNGAAMDSDAVLLINDDGEISGLDYATLLKSHLLMKDIYIYRQGSSLNMKELDFLSPRVINEKLDLISDFNKIQNLILNHLSISKQSSTEISRELDIRLDICNFELDRLVQRGVVFQNRSTYFIPNLEHDVIKRKSLKITKKY